MLCMVFTVMLSITVLRRTYYWRQYAAVVIVVGGLSIVAMADIYQLKDKEMGKV